MDEHQLLSTINAAKAEFGATCNKFSGAVTAQLLKQALEEHDIQTSARDVFIEQVPVEIDLLIPKRGVIPRHGLLYRAADVLVVFEVKNSGSFGARTIEKTGRDFCLVCARNPEIKCAYVTISERSTYKWKVTEENLKYPVYTLFWHRGSSKYRQDEASDDFARLLEFLRGVMVNNP
jgi:hypothetical protein